MKRRGQSLPGLCEFGADLSKRTLRQQSPHQSWPFTSCAHLCRPVWPGQAGCDVQSGQLTNAGVTRTGTLNEQTQVGAQGGVRCRLTLPLVVLSQVKVQVPPGGPVGGQAGVQRVSGKLCQRCVGWSPRLQPSLWDSACHAGPCPPGCEDNSSEHTM